MTNRPWAKRSRWITGMAVCASAVGLAALLGAAMTPPAAVPATAAALAPTDQENYVARRVSDIIAREHYRRAPLDDRLSSLILDRYLDAIDGGRSYFYASDIAEFEKYRYELDDAIKAGDMEPAFVIFRRYQQRSRERMNYAIELLGKKPDFDADETFNFDREKEPWPANAAEMNELWRKRVKNDALSLVTAGKTWAEASDVLRKRYEHVAKRMDQSKPEDVFEAFMNAFVLSLDPHSNYFSARNSEEYNIQMSLSYDGIGASLQLTDDYVTVINVIAGGPAAVSGKLADNDRITAVGEGKDRRVGGRHRLAPGRRGAEDPRARRHHRAAADPARRRRTRFGAEGAGVHCATRCPSRPRLRRRPCAPSCANGREIKVGIINRAQLLPGLRREPRRRQGFSQHHAGRAATHHRVAQGRHGRAHHGPCARTAAATCPRRNRSPGSSSTADPSCNCATPPAAWRWTTIRIRRFSTGGPMIVLVDRFSASASEIFAAAIQDYGRGLIIGQQTYGKGTVQNAHPLNYTIFGRKPELGQLNVTIGKYYRITGESTQDRGVTPDITMPSTLDSMPMRSARARANRALPWDHIDAAAFKVEGDLKPAAASLQKLHDERTANSADFRYLRDDIAALQTMRGEKTLSLNLKTREAERKRLDGERLERENAWRAAHDVKSREDAGRGEGRCGGGHSARRGVTDRRGHWP